MHDEAGDRGDRTTQRSFRAENGPPIRGLTVLLATGFKSSSNQPTRKPEEPEFARLTGLDILAAVQLELGSLDRVRRVVTLQGFVNATPDFEEHPQVLNGASDLMVEVFGERGVHARSVLGASSLRAGLPIVCEAIFEVD